MSSRPLQILPHLETILRHSTIPPASGGPFDGFRLGAEEGRLQPMRDRLSKTSDSVLRNRPTHVGRSAIVMPYRIVTSVKATPALRDACRGIFPKSGSRANGDMRSAKPLQLQAGTGRLSRGQVGEIESLAYALSSLKNSMQSLIVTFRKKAWGGCKRSSETGATTCHPCRYYTSVVQTRDPLGSAVLLMKVSKVLKNITMVVLYEDLGICPWTTEGRKNVMNKLRTKHRGDVVLIQVGRLTRPRTGVLITDANAGKRHEGCSRSEEARRK